MSDDRAETARCLLCGSAGLHVTYEDPKGRMVTSDCKPWPYAATVIVCMTCGHLQKLATEELDRQTQAAYAHYDLYHLSDGGEQFLFDACQEPPRSRSARILDRLQQLIDLHPSGQMLDVGCGNGAMLQAFGTRFPQWTLYGYEQNSRNRTRVLGLPGVVGFYEDGLDAIDRTFDLITLIHVLEHVRRPEHMLKQLHGLLAPQGVLLIQVPNAIENPFDMIIVDHYSHFSANVLSRFVTKLGYEVLCCTTDWVDKEITLVLRPGQRAQPEFDARPLALELVKRYQQNAEWLRRVARDAGQHAAHSHFGVFGTAIAGTWLGAVLGDSVRFFVDEDSRRVGKRHLGKPIRHPGELTPTDSVFLAFPYPIAERVYNRLSGVSRAEYLLPPAL